MMDLRNKRYLVTGAASGIGRQTALTLSECGANLLLIDINEDGLKKTATNSHTEVSTLCLDLTACEYDLRFVISNDVKSHGPLNGFVHCAGLAYISPIRSIKSEKAHRVFDINTFAALELAKVTTRKEIRADSSCSSVLISSVYGLVGSAANAAYAMSKGAIIALTKALAIEYAATGIRFNCVAPGFVKTEMLEQGSSAFDEDYTKSLEALHPLGLGNSKDISEPIAFLLSDAARWITGAVLSVDGGFTAR